jgi:hypothetical protein
MDLAERIYTVQPWLRPRSPLSVSGPDWVFERDRVKDLPGLPDMRPEFGNAGRILRLLPSPFRAAFANGLVRVATLDRGAQLELSTRPTSPA